MSRHSAAFHLYLFDILMYETMFEKMFTSIWGLMPALRAMDERNSK